MTTLTKFENDINNNMDRQAKVGAKTTTAGKEVIKAIGEMGKDLLMQGKRKYLMPKSLVPSKKVKMISLLDNDDDEPMMYEEPTTSYMNKVGEEMENILASTTAQQQYPSPNDIASSLAQLGNDVTAIKSTLQKKKPKITLLEISEKLDYLISILQQNGR